jgi:hypothetical protein
LEQVMFERLTRAKLVMLLVGLPLGAVATATRALADAAATRKQLKYQDKPGPKGAKCAGCTLFETPHSCSIIPGKISANGWCIAYIPKT